MGGHMSIMGSMKQRMLAGELLIEPTFRCDSGGRIRIGPRTFINYDCVARPITGTDRVALPEA